MTWKNEDNSPHRIGDNNGTFKSAALYADKKIILAIGSVVILEIEGVAQSIYDKAKIVLNHRGCSTASKGVGLCPLHRCCYATIHQTNFAA